MKCLNTLLSRLLDDSVILSVQGPIQPNDYSEPQPDLAILQHRYQKQQGDWKIVQWHGSAGIPNADVLGKDLTTE